MIKKLTSTIVKIPMLLAFLVVVATGCHTPEDMKEIGPQKPRVEEYTTPPPSIYQDKSTVVGGKNTVLSRSGEHENTVEVYGSGAVVIKTPFKPSLKIPKPRCKNC